jgi:hypothetical protein
MGPDEDLMNEGPALFASPGNSGIPGSPGYLVDVCLIFGPELAAPG